ncbi:MAG: Ig domain-containing protein [Gemmatimonadaceae bacterium]|nr:Ig domain-containing protein [Gemmatimonadaceae bacterium]
MPRTLLRLRAAALLSVTIACGGSPGSGLPTPPAQSIVSVDVSPALLNLDVGSAGTLIATARDAQGGVVPNTTFTWSSQASNVATVSSAGAVVGVAQGSSVVTATTAGVSGGAVVNVRALTLTMTPTSATANVGASVQFTVVAKDANGAVQPTPPLTWTSSNPSVATVSVSGQATGVSAGTAMIGASSGTLVAAPASLRINAPGRCDDIASRATFGAILGWTWGRNATTRTNHEIEALHRASLTSTLTRVSSLLDDEQVWRGPLVGTASVTDYDVNNNASPPTRSTIGGGGNVLTIVNGQPLPELTLVVDLVTCTYRFDVTPWIDMVLRDPDGATSRGPQPVGTLRLGWRALGAWRQAGIAGLAQYLWDAHGLPWLTLPGNAFRDGYFPDGMGQKFFESAATAADLTVPGPVGSWIFR